LRGHGGLEGGGRGRGGDDSVIEIGEGARAAVNLDGEKTSSRKTKVILSKRRQRFEGFGGRKEEEGRTVDLCRRADFSPLLPPRPAFRLRGCLELFSCS